MTPRLLILGGTTEARALTRRLVARGGVDVEVSLAGRTRAPLDQGARTRVGGFGGAEGLAHYLRETGVHALVDATHPFAAQISLNAVAAARAANVRLIRLVRPEWKPVAGDRWRIVDDVDAAIAALGATSRVVFVALGRQELAPLLDAPWHRYVIRSVDPVEPPLALPNARYILGRGPFAESDERAMLGEFHISCIVAKNSGGEATRGKLDAARALGVDVILIGRPPVSGGPLATGVDEAMAMIDHALAPIVEKRGV